MKTHEEIKMRIQNVRRATEMFRDKMKAEKFYAPLSDLIYLPVLDILDICEEILDRTEEKS